ncbi:hypothetical protein TNCV_3592801 [Trichonephila clavipes]|nr:hypothetical protein TNCV_3592801 [Trichonephila clavipes]
MVHLLNQTVLSQRNAMFPAEGHREPNPLEAWGVSIANPVLSCEELSPTFVLPFSRQWAKIYLYVWHLEMLRFSPTAAVLVKAITKNCLGGPTVDLDRLNAHLDQLNAQGLDSMPDPTKYPPSTHGVRAC